MCKRNAVFRFAGDGRMQTERTVRRCAHLSGEHRAPHPQRIGRIWAGSEDSSGSEEEKSCCERLFSS
jgi:hypothetical protein